MVDWDSKRVLIIGAARQGTALARYLANHGASVVLTDQRQPDELREEIKSLSGINIEWVLGDHPINLLDHCDIVCPSGGVPLDIPIIKEACIRNIRLSNDSQIFLESAPCTVIGITGSAGKTTVTTILGRIVEVYLGKDRTWVGGNIGNPLISSIDKMRSGHIAVMELSSFQLEIMDKSPQVAGMLNLTPNHLDRHLTMDNYRNAKSNILRYQSSEDMAVLGLDEPGIGDLLDLVQGHLFSFGIDWNTSKNPGVYLIKDMICYWDGISVSKIMPKNLISLRGEHNIKNVLAACALAFSVEIPFEAMIAGVQGFTGVEHRLESVRIWKGAEWINDSIATAPERSMAAIRSFKRPLVLLAGGRDKDLLWEEFADLVRERVDHLIIFGQAKDIISKAITMGDPKERPYSIDICDDLKEAVIAAENRAEEGDVVLLSPGCTSFDEFKDFAERGNWFKKWVKMLP